MAPHRKARAQQHHPPPQASDYETDAAAAAAMNVNSDMPPPPRSSEELNLSVIRRHYPDVMAIHYVVSYAALYIYALDPGGWERTGTEGSLFLCQLVPTPQGIERYSVIMLNRKGLENFTMEIKSPDDVEFSEFIMMQSDEGQVYGLWIMNDPPPSSTANARAELQDKLQDLAERAKRSRDAIDAIANQQPGTVYQEAEASVPMGRQLSLRELFGQPQQVQQAPLTQPPSQPDVLSQLFMKAKQDYHGMTG